MKPAFQRKRVWVDPPFQSRLLLRLTMYLAAYTFLGLHLAFLFEVMREVAGPGVKSFTTHYVEFLHRQLPVLVALLAMTPALMYDLLKFSHRVAGPLFRCRKVMEEMASGAVVREFTPRKGDLMREL